MVCCQNLPKTREALSPFQKVISASYYDGTTSGVAYCANCHREFFYKLFSWDDAQNVRIFGLYSVRQGTFEALHRVAGEMEIPRWPEWNVSFRGANAEAQRQTFLATVRESVQAKGPLQFIVATRDITTSIGFAKGLNDATSLAILSLQEDFDPKSFDRWMGFLSP